MSLTKGTPVSEKQLLRNKLFEDIHNVLYNHLCRLEIEYIEHGESFIIGKSEFKGMKINIKIEVK